MHPLLSVLTTTLTLPPAPADGSTWTESDLFYAGLKVGLVMGGFGFIFRVIRQIGKRAPEV